MIILTFFKGTAVPERESTEQSSELCFVRNPGQSNSCFCLGGAEGGWYVRKVWQFKHPQRHTGWNVKLLLQLHASQHLDSAIPSPSNTDD